MDEAERERQIQNDSAFVNKPNKDSDKEKSLKFNGFRIKQTRINNNIDNLKSVNRYRDNSFSHHKSSMDKNSVSISLPKINRVKSKYLLK